MKKTTFEDMGVDIGLNEYNSQVSRVICYGMNASRSRQWRALVHTVMNLWEPQKGILSWAAQRISASQDGLKMA